jgi:hypothetical protein
MNAILYRKKSGAGGLVQPPRKEGKGGKEVKPLCGLYNIPLPSVAQPRLLFFRGTPIIRHAILADFTAQLVRKVKLAAWKVASTRSATLDKRLDLDLIVVPVALTRLARFGKSPMSRMSTWMIFGIVHKSAYFA